MNYFADSLSESMSLDSVMDVDISGDKVIRIIGSDPYLVYALPEEGDFLNCKVIFADHISEVPLQLHIYYADSFTFFSEDKTVDVTVDAASDSVCFSLPEDMASVKYIRIDFDNTLSYVPTVHFVGLQYDTLTSRLSSFLLGIIYERLFVIPIILFVLAFALAYYIQNYNINSWQRDFAAIVIMAASFFILYFDYLLGNKAFSFYIEVGNDSFAQTYPNLVSQANRFTNGIWKEYANFRQGLGNHESSLVLEPSNWFVIFGENTVLKWMGISHYLKVLFAGILTYFWGKIYSRNSEVSFIVAFGYAMSSEFTVRGAWLSYPKVALLLVFWLLAFELQHRKGKWYLLPISTMLLFYSSGVYYCLIWGFLLSFYILFRELADSIGKIEWKKWLYTELLYISFAVIGMADMLVAHLTATFSSTRFTDAFARFSSSTYEILSDRRVIFSVFLRTIGQTIMGISLDDYLGDGNFLTGPVFYCGILLFLLIPISIYNIEGWKRFYYVLVILAAGLYIVVPPLRVVANGFSNDEFRLSSYWISIFMIIISMEVLMIIFSDKKLKKGSLGILYAISAATVIMAVAAVKLQYIARVDALIVSLMFIIIYNIIMRYIWLNYERKTFFLKGLCFVFAVETIVISWPTINDRGVISIDDLDKKKYYNDYSVDALDMITEGEDEWYRLEKSYRSVGLCDSLAQNYYGIESYIGGTEADPGIIAIYQALGLTRASKDYHYLMGTGGNIYASALLGAKYYLSKQNEVDRYGLQYLYSVGDVLVYENELALPMIYTYGQTVNEHDFNQLSIYDRSRNIVSACVVDLQNSEIENVTPSVFDFSQLSEYQQVYEQVGGGYQVDLDEHNVLIVRMMMSGEGHQQPISLLRNTGIASYQQISYGVGEKVMEVYCDGLQSIYFPDAMCADMESIEFYTVDAEEYYTELRHNVTELQNNAMIITAHDDIYNYIEGTVICDGPRILATSIPISNNWKILVDGQMVEVITVNKGFVGCYLDEGQHDIVIYYDGKNWLEANIFKVVGFIASIGILIVGIYRKRNKL